MVIQGVEAIHSCKPGVGRCEMAIRQALPRWQPAAGMANDWQECRPKVAIRWAHKSKRAEVLIGWRKYLVWLLSFSEGLFCQLRSAWRGRSSPVSRFASANNARTMVKDLSLAKYSACLRLKTFHCSRIIGACELGSNYKMFPSWISSALLMTIEDIHLPVHSDADCVCTE